MKKAGIVGIVTLAFTVAAAPSANAATAADYTGPCATAAELMEKYNIEFGMHFPLLEDTLHQVCRVTG